jgi:3-dehydroquinate synthase
MANQIKVKLSERSYSILIGNDSLLKLVDKINSLHLSKCLIVVDHNVNKFHSILLRKIFAAVDCKIFLYVFIASEKNKTLKQAEKIYHFLNTNYFGRDSAIIVIGGGITGDLAGFAASTYMRGIKFFQVPTTLLAMVDSSVGGKTGVNFNQQKNVVGTFYQPNVVYVYPEFLSTLPQKELLSGAGEVLKYSFLADKRNYLLLKKNLAKLFSGVEFNFNSLIISCLKIKSNIVMHDEKELTGLRKILNLGHTFAHAFEVESNYKLKHGEAVIAGVFCALLLSEIAGYISDEEINFFLNDFMFIKINELMKDLNSESVYKKMVGDKKNASGRIGFVLIEDIGSIIVDANVPKELIIESIKRLKKLI